MRLWWRRYEPMSAAQLPVAFSALPAHRSANGHLRNKRTRGTVPAEDEVQSRVTSVSSDWFKRSVVYLFRDRFRRTLASGPAEGAISAEVLRGRGGVAFEARALVVWGTHRVQELFEWIQVALARSGEGVLDEVVARDVDGVDPVHQVGVRTQRTPAVRPGVEPRDAEERAGRLPGVAPGGRAEVTVERRVIDLALLEQVEQFVDQRRCHRVVEAVGQPQLGPHAG